MATAADVIKIARSYIGYVEGPAPGHSGNLTIFGQWWGLDGQPWCDMFVSFCLYRAGVSHGPKGSKGFAYCPTDQDWYRKQGQLHSAPKVGDQAFYGFGHQLPVHTGLVVAVRNDGTFDAVEGNTSGGDNTNGGIVQIRHRRITDCTGFGRPTYTASTPAQRNAANRTQPKPAVISQHRQLGLTSPPARGTDVLTVQHGLITAGYLPKGQDDGIYGPATAKAVRAFQKARQLTVDGVCGPNTFHELHL